MRTLNITISELEYNKFGIGRDKLSFTEFVDLVSRELFRQTLHNCVQLANRFGLSGMTMDEITAEVNATRKDAKDHS